MSCVSEIGPLFVIPDLEPDSVYTIRAAAVNAAGAGRFGKEQNYRTKTLAVASAMDNEISAASSLAASLCLAVGALLLAHC
jgi:hypothetical protein